MPLNPAGRVFRAFLMILSFWSLLAAQAAAGGEGLPGAVIPAEVLSVHDGDTLTVRARLWLGLELTVALRLAGLDAAELKDPDPIKRREAQTARDFLARLTPPGTLLTLTRVGRDKYGGRVLACARLADGRDLSQALLASGLVHPYGKAATCP